MGERPMQDGTAHDGTGGTGGTDGTAHVGAGHHGAGHDGAAHDGAGQDGTAHDDGRIRRVVRVRGRVQGVGFRMDAAAAAARLGVGGTVRNLFDGTVEAALEGEPAQVEEMIEHLRRGPASARVDGLDVRRERPRGVADFRITG